MVRVRIDLPLVYSPTQAFGTISGEIVLDALPHGDDAFPWPQSWLDCGPPNLSDSNESRICSVSPWDLTPAEYLITMFGFVCDSITDARNCAAFFQSKGLDLLEY